MKYLNLFKDERKYIASKPNRALKYNSINYINGVKDITYDKQINLDDKIYFKDNELKRILSEKFGSNGEVSYKEALAVTELTGIFKDNKNITSAEGIQYFVNNNGELLELFSGCTNLVEIPSMMPKNYINEDAPLTAFSCNKLFYNCTGLQNAPYFDFSNIKILGGIFYGCENLEHIDINTKGIECYSNTFRRCRKLSDFTNIDTSNATTIVALFADCDLLTPEDMVKFDFSKVQAFVHAFARCKGLTYLPALQLPEAVVIEYLFMGDGNGQVIRVEPMEFPKAKYLIGAWQSLVKLPEFPVINFNGITYMGKNWNNCNQMTIFKSYDFRNVETLGYNWLNCKLLETFENELLVSDITHFNEYVDIQENPPYPDLYNPVVNRYTNHPAFKGCFALKNIKIKENTVNHNISFIDSPLLSDESIDSIIKSLKLQNEENPKTLTFHADVKSKLTEDQLAMITNKNWILE